MKKTILALMLMVGVVQGADTYEPRESDGRLMVAPERPVEAHDYSVEAYNIRPYRQMAPEAILDLISEHLDPEDFSPTNPWTPFVDENWLLVSDLARTLVSFDLHKGGWDGCFTTKNMTIRSILKGEWKYPIGLLFYYFKQVAWVDVEKAEQVAQHLTHGLTAPSNENGEIDFIPCRPDWAPHWIERARILKQSPLYVQLEDTAKDW